MRELLNFFGKASMALSGLVGFFMGWDWITGTFGIIGGILSILVLPLVAMIYPIFSGLFLSNWSPFLIVYGMLFGGIIIATMTDG